MADRSLKRQDAFSYTCNRCKLCCYAYTVRINPYETARLASKLGISTSEFLERHSMDDGIALKREKNGACTFLGPEGCTVHSDRPLACRLYPLGRYTDAEGKETFKPMQLQPGSEGQFCGPESSVAEFLAGQGVEPYIELADRYNALISKIVANRALEGSSGLNPAIVLDIDLALAEDGGSTLEFDANIEAKSLRHIEILRTRLELDGTEN